MVGWGSPARTIAGCTLGSAAVNASIGWWCIGRQGGDRYCGTQWSINFTPSSNRGADAAHDGRDRVTKVQRFALLEPRAARPALPDRVPHHLGLGGGAVPLPHGGWIPAPGSGA